MTRKNQTQLYKEQQVWFFVAAGLLLCVLILYVYFVCASVTHVVMRKEINREIAQTGSYVSQLEAQYIRSQHEMSSDIASMKGYVIAEDKVFIDRTQATLVLSTNNDS